MRGRRASLLMSLLMTAALVYLLPWLLSPAASPDGNRMDERLRPPRMRTLTVWMMPGDIDDRKLISEACAAFEKERPGVRVFLRTVTAEEWAAQDAVLPDVALLATGSMNIPQEVFIPLADVEEAGASGRSGGVSYAVPLWLEAGVLSLPSAWAGDGAPAAPAASPLFSLATPAPEEPSNGLIAAEDLPWRRLLEPGALALPSGVALQQLLFVCPAQLRGELSALAHAQPAASGAAQARVCTLGEHIAATEGGAERTACLLLPAVSDRVRYAALCRDGEDARAFVSMLMEEAWQARAAAGNLVPALVRTGAAHALTGAAIERFAGNMVLPNAFAHTASELEGLCMDAFMRAQDPVETLLRLR